LLKELPFDIFRIFFTPALSQFFGISKRGARWMIDITLQRNNTGFAEEKFLSETIH